MLSPLWKIGNRTIQCDDDGWWVDGKRMDTETGAVLDAACLCKTSGSFPAFMLAWFLRDFGIADEHGRDGAFMTCSEVTAYVRKHYYWEHTL